MLKHLKLIPILILSLLLAGCAGFAMQRGDDLAALGKWEQALEAYEEAYASAPDSPDARAKLLEAREHVARRHLEISRQLSAQQRWKEAFTKIRDAQRLAPDLIGIKKQSNVIHSGLCRQARERLRLSDYAGAKAHTLDAISLFPDSATPPEILREIQQTLIARADASRRDAPEDFQRRLDLYNTLQTLFPNQKRFASGQIQETNTAWAELLRDKARAAQRKRQKATAFIYYAMAASRAGNGDDIKQREVLREALIKEGQFTLAFKANRGAQAIQRSLLNSINNDPELVPGTRGRHVILTDLSVKEERCERLSSNSYQQKPYVSGTRRVTNPEWVKLKDQLSQERLTLAQQKATAQELRRNLNARLQQAERHHEVLQDTRELQRAQRHLDTLRVRQRQAKLRLEEERKKLARLQDQRRALVRTQQTLKSTQNELKTAERDITTMEQARDSFNQRRDDLKRKLASLEEKIEDAEPQQPNTKPPSREAIAKLKRLKKRLKETEIALKTLKQERKAHRQQLKQARSRVQALRNDIRDLKAEVARMTQGSDALDDLAHSVKALEREHQDATSSTQSAERKLNNIINARNKEQHNLDVATRDIAQVRGRIERLNRETFTQEHRINNTVNTLTRTPEQIDEEIISQFRYEVKHWTQTCHTELNLSLRPSRQISKALDLNKLSIDERITATHHTKDASHPAHLKYGVSEDPLTFPQTESDLISRNTQELSRRSLKFIQQASRKYYSHLTQRARQLSQTNPEEASRLFLTALFLKPNDIPPGLSQHLTRYNLTQTAVLTMR